MQRSKGEGSENMRVCPKCGYSENLLWQQDRFAANLMFMRAEDFEKEYPELYKRFMNAENNIVEGNFLYRLKANKLYVRRYEIIGGSMATNYEAAASWTSKSLSRFVRKVNAKRAKGQTKLLEVKPT